MVTHGGHGHTGVRALLGAQRCTVTACQQLNRIGPRIVQAAGVFRSRVSQPDNQQVGRGAPALRPGEGAAQGLALFARGLGCLPCRLGRGLSLGPLLAFALGLLVCDHPRRLPNDDRRISVDIGRDP